MNKHDKGPWHSAGPSPYGIFRIKDASDRVLALTPDDNTPNTKSEANALLMAAAPELLEALNYIATEGSDCPPSIEPAEFYRGQLLACIGHAARAIAKAEGR